MRGSKVRVLSAAPLPFSSQATKVNGIAPDIITVSIDSWIEINHWKEKCNIEYSTKKPKPKLSATINLNGAKLRVIQPLGKFPKKPILFSSKAISWSVKIFPKGALYSGLGNHQIFPLK